ncbi:MAG: HAMP domain-containing sensor histidine kinase [Planctomycetia bacterium]|nr:HAMP domain-containing sensor histidine kinase [Planctomycetia bacterium]
MRWSIQRQLLAPMLLVVVVSSVLSSSVSAWVGSSWARREETDRLGRVVATLTDVSFPLQERVLQKMAGLSGADFVVWDQQQLVQSATLPLDDSSREQLKRVPETGPLSDLSRNPTLVIQGRSYLTANVPLRRTGTRPLSLLVLYPEDRWWTATRGAIVPPIIAGGVTALIAVVLTTWWARHFVRPIAQLSRQSEEIANGVFQPMQLPTRDDELRDLTQSINRMVEQLTRYEQQVRRNERLKTLGQLGAGLAHQLRNWLTGARMALQLHVRECPLGTSAESMEMALQQITLMESYLQRFLKLGAGRNEAPRPTERKEVSLPLLIDDVLSLIRPRARHVGVELEWSPPVSPFVVVGDREELQELLVNLLLNGIDAAVQSNATARVRIELDRTDIDQVRLRIIDNGPGPNASIAAQLFEPFVTDKPEGTGLGLAVAKQILETHNGKLSWRRDANETVFEMELPAKQDVVESASELHLQ